MISFIPTLYAAFQRREVSVSRLSVRAGVPATPWGILEIAQSVNSYDLLDELWREWEQWFIEVGETHSTLTDLELLPFTDAESDVDRVGRLVLDAAALFNPSSTSRHLLRRALHSLGLAEPAASRGLL